MEDDLLPNLMQLWKFVTVAEQGSINRAASALLTGQPSLSRAIHELEALLGVSLFERSASGVLLTQAGQVVLSRSRRVFAELDSADVIAQAHRTPRRAQRYLLNHRRLSIFVALCKSQLMQVAAAQLAVTQPAISIAIKNLETGCGQALFERSSKGVQPTRTAAEMAYPVKRALAELRHVRADLDFLRGVLSGVVYLGALPLGRSRILPTAIERVVTQHPAIQIVTNESAFGVLATDMRSGEIDMIFGAIRQEDARSEFVSEPLISEKLVLLARRGHPMAEISQLGKLAGARWILPRRASPARQLLDLHFSASGMPSPVPAVETGDLAIIRGLLLYSDMIAAVSEHQLDYEIRSGELVSLRVELTGTSRQLGLTYRRNWLPSPAALALADAIRAVATERVGEVTTEAL
jgi:LysR family transcriptional regulator, regulator for genes of the gallate degradation pathway